MQDSTPFPSSKAEVGNFLDGAFDNALRVMEDSDPEKVHNIILGVFYMVLEDALMFPPHAASQL